MFKQDGSKRPKLIGLEIEQANCGILWQPWVSCNSRGKSYWRDAFREWRHPRVVRSLSGSMVMARTSAPEPCYLVCFAKAEKS